MDADHLAISGIYTNEDLNRLREHIMFPVEQPTLIRNFAKAATGQRVPVSGISLNHLLDEDALAKITASTTERLWSGFMQFGTATAAIIGIWLVIKAIKVVADTLIHCYALHTMYGWSIHLLGAIFASVTNLLLHLGRIAARKPRDSTPRSIQLTPLRQTIQL